MSIKTGIGLLLVAIIGALLGLCSQAEAVDSDKQLHALLSAIPAGAANVYLYNTSSMTTGERLATAALIGMAPGIGKEALDSQEEGNRWDWEDIGADGVGVGISLLVTEGLCRLAGPSRYAVIVSADNSQTTVAVAGTW